MRVLVTNDDGFDAPGLAVLARAFVEAGHEVLVVAPLVEASGSGAGIGPVRAMGDGIRVEAVAPPGLGGITAFAADALPALIVMMACLGAFGPTPDLVASGINPGRNVGRAVLHSGTVGAALTCVHFGLKGLATSIRAVSAPPAHQPRGDAHTHFESAAALAVTFAAHLERAPARTVLNLNVPDLALGEIRGVRRAGLAASGLILAAQAVDGRARVRLDFGASDPGASKPDIGDESDETLTGLGWAVVTPLVSVTEDKRPETGDIVAAAMASASRCLETARGRHRV
jgi:5'-nucleotidase